MLPIFSHYYSNLKKKLFYHIMFNNTVLGRNKERNHFKNFNNADRIIQKIENYQKQNIVSSKICKCQKQDHNLSEGDFHKTVARPFIHALIEEIKNAFDISHLPVLKCILKLVLRVS